MVDTNALLSIAFSLITNFTNVVYVPPQEVPQSTNDLQAYRVGTLARPCDVYLGHKSGTHFWIFEGTVQIFRTSESVFTLQDPNEARRFVGVPQLSSNQVFELASSTVRRLVKSGDPLRGITPIVRAAGPYKGQAIPFYRVSWPRPNAPSWSAVAEVEVDARSGRIASLSLGDLGFGDPTRDQQITKQVYRPPPPRVIARRKTELPHPSTNEVRLGIQSWLRLCARLRVDPGKETNFTDVNWDQSFVFPSRIFPSARRAYRVTFNNSTLFDTVDRGIVGHRSWDSYYPVQRYRWTNFQGTIRFRSQELASAFERTLAEDFGVPKKRLTSYHSIEQSVMPAVGESGLTRGQVAWLRWPSPTYRGSEEGLPLGFLIEFDLQTGAIKSFGFRDPKLIEAFCRGQEAGR